jgi:membrane fusion protein, heavy metal efflux system
MILAAITALFAACEHVHEHNHHNAGNSEMEALAYTLYSNKTELFVEFKPLVVGKETRFAAHFTMLGENFLPVTEGSVTLKLVGLGGEQQIVSNAPSNPGIFRLALTPQKTGTYTLQFDIKTKNYTDLITIDSVVVYADEQAAIAAQKAEPAGNNTINYLKEQAWKIEFANDVIRKQPFSEVIYSSGQLLSAMNDERIIVASSTGILLFAGSGIASGSEVNAGETLFIISGGALTGSNVDARFKAAKTNYDKAETDYLRAKELAAKKIISQQELLNIQTQFENARTAFNLVSKDYSAGGQRISAPMNGFIKSINVAQGQFVTEGQPIAVVSQNRRLILRVDVPAIQFPKLALATSANFKIAGNDSLFSTTTLNGKLVSYSKSIDANSPYASVTFEIDNTNGIVPGAYAEVFLKLAESNDVIIVPHSSLIEEQGHFFVYVQTAGESFEKREIKTGVSDGKYIKVVSGVRAGERVVSKGAFQIKLATMSGAMPAHGHEH